MIRAEPASAIDRGVALLAAAVVALLVALAASYGYHLDELYFLVAGRALGQISGRSSRR
jgi:hypothetical protein